MLYKFLYCDDDGDVIAILSRFNCSALAPESFLISVTVVSICFARGAKATEKRNIGRRKEGACFRRSWAHGTALSPAAAGQAGPSSAEPRRWLGLGLGLGPRRSTADGNGRSGGRAGGRSVGRSYLPAFEIFSGL